jgi:glycosyltransferase involved in cell wall biosynthesis
MAASLPLDNIIFTGHQNDVANYLQIMDVFLYPSPSEGFGLVFAEAMHCGALVVTYDNSVNREVCGGYSILTENSIPGLVRGVEKALNVPVRDAIIPMAREWVAEQFAAERMARDYAELYRSVMPAREEVPV